MGPSRSAALRRWLPLLLRGLSGAVVLAWAIHLLARFGPGEIRRGLEPFGLWPPLIGLFGLAGGAGVWGAFRDARRPAERPSATDVPSTSAAPGRAWIDLLIALAIGLGLYVAVGAWIARANPHGVLLGMDGPSYLRTIVAVATEDWYHYNNDKRILHAWLGAALLGGPGGSPLAAAQLLSHLAASALAPLGYLLARTVTGRGEALIVALLVALHPSAWVFATQSTNYALFFAIIAAALAALVWALARPHPLRWALAGLLAGLALSTQEKAVLTLGPAVFVGVPMALLGDRSLFRPLLRGLVVGTIGAIAVVVALDPPISYTAFGSLVANQRQELHREMPWAWPAVRQPDKTRPTDPRLPERLRGGELEAALSALTTPADSDVLRFRPDDHGGTWFTARDTSIAPLRERLRLNVRALEHPTLPRVGLLEAVAAP